MEDATRTRIWMLLVGVTTGTMIYSGFRNWLYFIPAAFGLVLLFRLVGRLKSLQPLTPVKVERDGSMMEDPEPKLVERNDFVPEKVDEVVSPEGIKEEEFIPEEIDADIVEAAKEEAEGQEAIEKSSEDEHIEEPKANQ